MNSAMNWMSVLRMAAFALTMVMGMGMGSETLAQTPPASVAPDTCTNFGERWQEVFTDKMGASMPLPGEEDEGGILTQIYTFITTIVDDATKTIFENFTKNEGYQQAVYAATVLSVILFGVFFTVGLVQLTAGQVLVRLIKMGLIFSVISPTGWQFFSDYAVTFFNGGTDEIIRGVIQISMGGSPLPPNASPFYQLDKLGEFMISPESLTMVVGMLTSGPFGMGMGALSMIAFGAFIKMLIDALRNYAVCYVVRSLLLGLAPIFIVFLLFERTKQLFNTWLNSLISCSLQPILLFTFLAFFTVMIEGAAKNMFSAELCYVEFEQVEGNANRISGFRFVGPDGTIQIDENTWRGPMTCLLNPGGKADDGSECPEFPIKILDVLTFLMLVFLASRFSEVIDRIANELSNTFVSLDAAGRFDQFTRELASLGSNTSGTGGRRRSV